MVNPQMVMYEEEFNQIQTVVDRLVREANAKVVFIVDKNGQLIAASGDVDNIDTTSLASLTAGNIAATGGIAKLLRENEFALMRGPRRAQPQTHRVDRGLHHLPRCFRLRAGCTRRSYWTTSLSRPLGTPSAQPSMTTRSVLA